MEFEQFDALVRRQLARSEEVLLIKAREYATDDDRLANFKMIANMQGITPQQAVANLMAKHTYSIFAMCATGQPYTTAQWDEKITDHINYLILLRAVLEDVFNSPAGYEEYTPEDNAVRDRVTLNRIARILSDSKDWGSEEMSQIHHLVEQVRTVETD